MPSTAEAVAFLERQRQVQSPSFSASQGQYVLSFLGTTSARGITAAMSVHELVGFTGGAAGSPYRLELRGALAREPFAGEAVTVSITDWERFRGYQLKTEAAVGDGDLGLCLRPAPDRVALQAAQVFTVHHTPNTVHMFETIPVEDVVETARVARWAVAGVGPTANISPRFVITFEVTDGTLSLFHGDGAANKTWMNLQQNNAASRVVFDRTDGRGLLFEGPCEEVAPGDAPGAYQELRRHYGRLGYGPPTRVYRQRVDRVAAV
jgi:hypothetical protein